MTRKEQRGVICCMSCYHKHYDIMHRPLNAKDPRWPPKRCFCSCHIYDEFGLDRKI